WSDDLAGCDCPRWRDGRRCAEYDWRECFFGAKRAGRLARILRGNTIAYCAKAPAPAWTNQRQFQRVIYLDYNATTPLCEAACSAMLPFLGGKFGNPSSIHAAGREARAAIDDARDRLANLLDTKPHELIFTNGGTETNNLAILGLARSRAARGKHLISAKTEHHAVLNAVEHLEKFEGFEITWLNVSENGLIDLNQLADSIRDDTVLVSIMHANNETGVSQSLRLISEVCRELGVLLPSDLAQSFGQVSDAVVSQV